MKKIEVFNLLEKMEVEFNPLSQNSPIVEIIDEDFVVLSHCEFNITYSITEDMFNATKFVVDISGRRFKIGWEIKNIKHFYQDFHNSLNTSAVKTV